MLVAGETLNIFLLTEISNINIFFIKKNNVVVVVLAPHGEVAKPFPVVRLATHKLIVFVDAVVWVKLLATTLAGKHMATVLPNCVLARHLQRLESFVTDITGVNPLSLLCFIPQHWSHPATN